MNNDLEKIGLKIDNQNASSIQLYVVNNPDGTPRWIWNAENPKPDFLRFYSVSNWRSRLFSTAFKLVFFLKLQHVVFRKKSIKVSRDEQHVLAPFTDNHFALFMGTPGPNRKLVLFANGQFIKIGLNVSTNRSLDNEVINLSSVNNGRFIEMPVCIKISKGIVAFSDLGKDGKRTTQFTELHAAALAELYTQKPSCSKLFCQTDSFNLSFFLLEKYKVQSENLSPVHLKDKLSVLAEMVSKKQLSYTWAHRDFTPWNCYESNNKIKIYDFELAHQQLPFGFDAFHFVMQQGILVNRLPWKQIKPLLRDAFEKMKDVSGNGNESFDEYLQAYLFINTMYHIDLYTRQKVWHEQVYWLFNTWNDALSDVLQNETKQRALMIGDVFDFLKHKVYATIKFPNIPPGSLSEHSDIDCLVSKSTANHLLSFLKQHSLVKKINVQVQSKMMRLLVVLQNDQLLALDLIWKLKVKSLEFMDVDLAIKSAVLNDYGIKVLNHTDNENYLRFFYGLNGSEIPRKYNMYLNGTQLQNDFVGLRNHVKQFASNRGVSAWRNTINYITDVIRQFLFQKGLIITFSGVDGAGKSTIIEHTKKELEKKLRKKVVIIRHRPSLLPILSALTQGKEAAEIKAANTLPRQGNNKSVISSLIRFGYYYTDYLFGQFYIYAKHVLRGEVVLYDRYYFDFINDSLRSNIRLPKWFTKAGYKLLLKPHLNFFLYADAETILTRKKELDETAITSLTNDYLELFNELEKQSKGKYFPIENLQLKDTLSFISSTTKQQLI